MGSLAKFERQKRKQAATTNESCLFQAVSENRDLAYKTPQADRGHSGLFVYIEGGTTGMDDLHME